MRCNQPWASSISGLAILLTMFLAGEGVASNQNKLQPHDKFQDRLNDIILNAGPNELIPITIVLRDQTNRDVIDQAARIADKQQRRLAVIAALKSTAAETQGDLLQFLAERQQVGRVGGRVTPLWIHNVIAAEVTPGVAFELAKRDDVAYMNDDAAVGQEVFPVEHQKQNGDLGPQGSVECGVDLIGSPDVWNSGYTGQGVVVCVIDTGCCITHPDLQSQIWANPGEIPNNNIDDDNNGHIDDVHGWNFRDNTNLLTDTNGHGTAVSGTVLGDGASGIQTGVAPDASLMTCKFWNDIAGEQVAWNCVQYAVENGADVINGSFGWIYAWNPDRTTWRTICENSMAAGVVLVFAAGNEGGSPNSPNDVRTPGDVPEIITVGATNCSDSLAGYSSRGPITWQSIPPYFDWPFPPGKIKPTVCGPGDGSTTTAVCNGYTGFGGTSGASPFVAGCVALMLSANPDLDHFQCKQILKDTALDLGSNGPDNLYGYGRINVAAAVEAALDLVDEIVTADEMTVFRGFQISGDLSDTTQSDDSYVKVTPGITFSPLEPPVWLIFDGTLPNDAPQSLNVTLEASANTVNLMQTIEMFNWNTNSYQQIDARIAQQFDETLNVDVSVDIADFVQPGTGAVRTRIGWRANGPIFVFPWTICLDQIGWISE